MLFLKKYLGVLVKEKNELSCEYSDYYAETKRKLLGVFKRQVLFCANVRVKVITGEMKKLGIDLS